MLRGRDDIFGSGASSAGQLIVTCTDMTQQSGNFTIWWSNRIATTPFTIAP